MTTITAEIPTSEDTTAGKATTPARPPVDRPDPISGLTTADEEAIARASAEVFKVCSNAAVRVLKAQRPSLQQRVTHTETILTEARAALEGPQAVVDKLSAELAECQRRGEEVKLASDDESLTVRLEARSLKLAIEEETASLRERVTLATRVTDPLVVAVTAADREVKIARARLTEHDQAAEFPFVSDIGKATGGYMRFMLATGSWFHSTGPEARAIVLEALRLTGIGAEVERNAIGAYISGDPAARSIGTSTKRWPDGTTLIHTPGGADIVTTGRATAADLSAAPAVPWGTGPGAGAAEVITGIRTGFGWPEP